MFAKLKLFECIFVLVSILIADVFTVIAVAQDYEFDLRGRSEYKYKNVSTNRCLNLHGRDNQEGGISSLFSCAETHDQDWYVVFDEAPWVHLVNRSSGKCLNVHGRDNTDGGLVTVYTCATTPDQQWRVIDIGADKVKFRNRQTNRCLNVAGRDDREGGPATVYSCANTPDQEWVGASQSGAFDCAVYNVSGFGPFSVTVINHGAENGNCKSYRMLPSWSYPTN